MIGHYVRVQEAAAMLGVSPATIRWYSHAGWLPTYRVGRGQVPHRRFRYGDLRVVARRTGKFLPDEPTWDRTVPITVEMAGQYLALSPRYLVDAGWMKPGAVIAWEELEQLEGRIYGEPEGQEPAAQAKEEKGGASMMQEMMERGCGCGPRGRGRGFMGGAGRMGPGAMGWPDADQPAEAASLLALRRARRHLEAQRADIEDQIADLDRRIRLHPDNQETT